MMKIIFLSPRIYPRMRIQNNRSPNSLKLHCIKLESRGKVPRSRDSRPDIVPLS